MAFFEILSGLGSLASAGAGVASLFKDQSFNPYENNPALIGMLRANKMAELFAKWAAMPNSQAFKNLEGLEREKIQAGFISSLRDIMRMNAVERARGGAGFGINPERRDEARYRAQLEANEAAKSNARTTARQYLLTAAQGQAAAAQGYGPAAGILGDASMFNFKTGIEQQDATIRALEGLPQALQDFVNIFQGQPSRGGFGTAMGARSGTVPNVNPYYSRIAGTGGLY